MVNKDVYNGNSNSDSDSQDNVYVAFTTALREFTWPICLNWQL